MARFLGCLTPMVARLPMPISMSPSPVITATRRAAVPPRHREPQAYYRCRAHRAPEIEVERMVAAGGDVVGGRADARDHHEVAAVCEQARHELPAVHHRWPPCLLRSTMRCDSR